MRRSKLELYIDILKALALHGPLKLTHLMYDVNISCSILKPYLDFLINEKLIEERILSKKRVEYSVAQKGMDVIKNFEKMEQALSGIGEI